MSQFFAADRINLNTTNTNQSFSTDENDNLVVTETFETILTPEQVVVLKQSLQDQIDIVQSESTTKVSALQTLLDSVNNAT